MQHVKYTKELLEVAVRDSISIQGVMRTLGLKIAGGTHAHLSRKIKKWDINTSHFSGGRSNSGDNHRGGPDKKLSHEILVNDRHRGRKEGTKVLRRAMIESGVPYVCAICGDPPEWKGKPLVLPIDHVDGNNLDNRPENVRFTCPNCHSQTETFGTRNRKI